MIDKCFRDRLHAIGYEPVTGEMTVGEAEAKCFEMNPADEDDWLFLDAPFRFAIDKLRPHVACVARKLPAKGA